MMNWPTINQDMGINKLLLQRFFLIILKGINEDKIRLVSVNTFVLYLTSLSMVYDVVSRGIPPFFG
jgi:hypothetical protein